MINKRIRETRRGLIQISKINEEGIKEDGDQARRNVLGVEEIMNLKTILNLQGLDTIVVKKVILSFTILRRLGIRQLRGSDVNENRSRLSHKGLQDKSLP